ncbi:MULTISPECIES: tRNA uridine-5-carboxymethylaminomethyl(34) synthesis GTPase MnmE [unclassified Campylobacter]|uniref:tRNA uridine-5-carboxymethylaminomethyl(34) synthesis GTPase MnmE n=1 Tax=unclassified Campylobacter TaxID=2593542 RepID=UPI000874BC6A|nr:MULTISPECIES: tRNA uridine-5-carboxymethylaminomethyl(34) synthesis GTPase MnmE [unclassified Campylobacter]EAB5249303.1 tRNA uridine-5-carboxymethylaminomethyl(34) synthesis GTPase MnmE [Campylobacter jejuni]EAK7750428.1 tRNA uridine-5-carboxymethylaminomethyl(34) synthesis GTPase MnmE [Campylobacter jejuni]EDP2686074.1 tRNA uridine-5-carboxymethylaminomethyl(34) synthesis GTPase MnmE [Campylobacter jejuni]MCW1872157.1 tRNA uridine-5-carboxymethylaminomethyl(34) synthesis GTPase MnmE [Campy
MSDTIAAIATAHGVGSISIVRLSGERALEFALKLSHKTKLTPRHATFTKLFNQNNEIIDEAIMIYFKAPYSFTGEDIVEFQTHGGFSVSEVLLEELVSLGARLALAGEFSKRACLNGKMTPLKALNIQDLILSKSALAAKIIARNMQGNLGELLEKIRTDLVKTLAFVETSIDYADDDLPSDLLEQISTMCEENSKILKEVYTLSQSKKGLIEGFKIAIVGKPNVGKSSLLNALLSYERAIVSDIAGTTRDTIEESFKLGTHLLRIIDTAGIRESKDAIEQIGVALSKKSLEDADIILAVFDASRVQDKEDEKIFDLLANTDKKIFWILNKSDLENVFKNTQNKNFIKLSAQKDITLLKEELQNYLNSFDSEGIMVSSLDLINACKISSEAIFRAKGLLEESSLELFAFELNLAINELARFTKDFQRDEILDEMFGNFCLGK